MTLPNPYQRSPKIGLEFSSEPGCIGPPRAASAVKAATVSAAPAIAAGAPTIRASSSAAPVNITAQPSMAQTATTPGWSLRYQGTAPVSIIDASQTVPIVKISRVILSRRRMTPAIMINPSAVPAKPTPR